MINEFDNKKYMSKNFMRHREVLQNLSVITIIKAYDYINTLQQFIPQENEVIDDIEDVLEPLVVVINELMSDEICPLCSNNLFLSDLPQYDYVCVNCDENF